MRASAKNKGLLNMEEVWDFYRENLLRVEDKINKTLTSSVGLINDLAHYIFESGGKRFRPLLMTIACRVGGKEDHGDADILLATSVEFIHTATLLHDDVIDQAEIRRGKKSAHMLWGNQANILVGDYLYIQAVTCALRLANHEVNMILAEACRLMTEGETLQLTHNGDFHISEQDYLRVIRCKTAALLSATCQLGGIIGESNAAQKEALTQFGLHLGTAYQLVDDTLDYVADQDLLGKSLGKDLKEGKITLPLLHLLSRCSAGEKERIGNIVKSGSLAAQDLQDIRDLMNHYGSIDYSMGQARESIQKAKNSLEFFPPSIHRQALDVVADYAVSRDH